jgi:hypothetical protein
MQIADGQEKEPCYRMDMFKILFTLEVIKAIDREMDSVKFTRKSLTNRYRYGI